MTDLGVGWRSGGRWAAAEPFYRAEDGHSQYKYLPVFGGAMAPLSKLPLPLAKTIWYYVCIGALAGSIALSLALLPRPKRSAALLAVATTVVMAKFFAHEVNLGQFNAVMLVLVLAAFFFLRRGHPIMAGVSLALA